MIPIIFIIFILSIFFIFFVIIVVFILIARLLIISLPSAFLFVFIWFEGSISQNSSCFICYSIYFFLIDFKCLQSFLEWLYTIKPHISGSFVKILTDVDRFFFQLLHFIQTWVQKARISFRWLNYWCLSKRVLFLDYFFSWNEPNHKKYWCYLWVALSGKGFDLLFVLLR